MACEGPMEEEESPAWPFRLHTAPYHCRPDAEQSVRIASTLGLIGGCSAVKSVLRMATLSIGCFSFLIFLT